MSAADGPWGRQTNNVTQFPTRTEPNDFRPLSPSGWQGRTPPDRDWMVQNAMLRGTVVLINGVGGSGKSLLVQQLCSCAVLGKTWLGVSVKPGRALYLACEDDHDELWRRQAKINEHLDCDMDDLTDGGLYLYPRVGQDNTLMRMDREKWTMVPTQMFERMRAHCQRNGISYVILDTAQHVYGGNPNDGRLVTQFIGECRRFAVLIQGVVIVTQQPSMNGRIQRTGLSGNTAWESAARARFYLHRKKKGDPLFFESMKANYSPNELKLQLVYRRGVYMVDEPPLNWAGSKD